MMCGASGNGKVYTTRLQKGGALLDDMRLLVRAWSDEASHDEQRRQMILDNLLGKKTRARAADVFRRSFSHRFLNGDPPDAWKLVRPLEDADLDISILKPVYYWVTARSERLLYDFVAEEIMPRSKGHDLSVRIDETASWIKGKLSEQRQSWTDTVLLKVSRGLLATLRDFGMLEGASRKTIAPAYVPIEAFSFIAFFLHSLGARGEKLITHNDWGLFLLDVPVVERLFLEAHQRHLLSYHAAGKIHRIDFPAETTEGMAHVIAGRA